MHDDDIEPDASTRSMRDSAHRESTMQRREGHDALSRDKPTNKIRDKIGIYRCLGQVQAVCERVGPSEFVI